MWCAFLLGGIGGLSLKKLSAITHDDVQLNICAQQKNHDRSISCDNFTAYHGGGVGCTDLCSNRRGGTAATLASLSWGEIPQDALIRFAKIKR